MAAIEGILEWIKNGGSKSKEPVIDKKPALPTSKINWKIDNELQSLFSGIEDSASYLRYTNKSPYFIDKTFIKNLGTVLERETGATFDINVDSTGTQIATALGFGPEAQKVAGVPTVSFDDLWNAQSDETKAKVIYEYYLEAAGFPSGATSGTKMIGKSVKAADIYKSQLDAEQKTVVSPLRRNFAYWLNGGPTRSYTDNYTIGFSFAIQINSIFFHDKAFALVNMLDDSLVTDKINEIAANTSQTQAEVIAALQAKNLAANSLLAEDLFEEVEEDSENFNQRKEFFKKIEQCILLNIVDKLGKFSQNDRQITLQDKNKKLPYGGRVICVKTDENMYSNYANSDGEAWNYSRNLTQTYFTNTSTAFNFIISKIQTIDTKDGPKEVEMPLLFEGAENFLYDPPVPLDPDLRGKFKGIKIFTEDKERTNDITVYDLIRRKGSSTNDAIKFENISIKFHGENQATAKSNVDVDLTISIPNLLLFQAQFVSNTFYTNNNGEKVNHEYTYSLVDLITYLHRTDLGDVYKKLSVGGSRLFQPKYFRNYNRLAMKIVAIPSDAGLESDSDYKKIKEHLENNPLILDLALIDHTIEKDSANQEAKIKISYKGYIKSFLQNPKFDIIRTPDEIRNEIALEREFIDELQFQSDSDAIKSIDSHNKRILDDTQEKVKSVSLFNDLISRDKMNYYEVDANNFVNSISKKYELLSINTISKNFSVDNINSVATQSTGEFGDAIKGKLNRTGTYKLKYFYLGDLIEIMMGNFYKISGARIDALRESSKEFPFKVILPNFEPLTTDGNDRKLSGFEISVADFPISYEWFSNWYIEEFVESEIDFYTIGTFVNRLVSDVLTGFLNDNCYLQGHHSRKMFATRADFGLFSKDISKNYNYKQANYTDFDVFNMNLYTQAAPVPSEIPLFKSDAPFFKKDPKIPRNDHCNFLFVYPQIAMFSDFKGIQPNETDWEKYNVPEIQTSLLNNILKKEESVYTTSISFSKEEANYRREARFQTEKLYSLAQLASVYNITTEVKPSLDIFPGMLVWVNAGFYQSPNVLYSIANILGMGGYHLVESVTHTGEIAGNTINNFKTQITANWVSNASIRLENEIPKESSSKLQLITTQGSAQDTAQKNNVDVEVLSGGETQSVKGFFPKVSIGNFQMNINGDNIIFVKRKNDNEISGTIKATIGGVKVDTNLTKFKKGKTMVWGFKHPKQNADTKWEATYTMVENK